MTNPLETISPENKDSLERLNDERMHNGLEAVPVEPIGGAHDQRGEEPEADERGELCLSDLITLKSDALNVINELEYLRESVGSAVDKGHLPDSFSSLCDPCNETMNDLVALDDYLADLIRETEHERVVKLHECLDALEEIAQMSANPNDDMMAIADSLRALIGEI